VADKAREIDWEYLDRAATAEVHVGELVSADAGGMPIYQVMELSNGRAWLRDVDDGSDRVTPLADFHWKARG